MKNLFLFFSTLVLLTTIVFGREVEIRKNQGAKKLISPLTDRPGQVYHKQDLFNPKAPVTFFGVDYSHVRVSGNNMMDIKDQFTTVNTLLLTEKTKYNLTEALWRSKQINYDFTTVNTKNDKINDSLLYSPKLATFTDFDIQKYVDELNLASYNTPEGIGVVIMGQLLYNMGEDGFGNAKEESTYYYIFFDISSKKLLFSEKIGILEERYTNQNLWALALRKSMHNVRDVRYQYWKNSYGK